MRSVPRKTKLLEQRPDLSPDGRVLLVFTRRRKVKPQIQRMASIAEQLVCAQRYTCTACPLIRGQPWLIAMRDGGVRAGAHGVLGHTTVACGDHLHTLRGAETMAGTLGAGRVARQNNLSLGARQRTQRLGADRVGQRPTWRARTRPAHRGVVVMVSLCRGEMDLA